MGLLKIPSSSFFFFFFKEAKSGGSGGREKKIGGGGRSCRWGKMVDQESLPPAPHLEMVVARIWECLLGQGVENRRSKGRDLKASYLEARRVAFFQKQLWLPQLSG